MGIKHSSSLKVATAAVDMSSDRKEMLPVVPSSFGGGNESHHNSSPSGLSNTQRKRSGSHLKTDLPSSSSCSFADGVKYYREKDVDEGSSKFSKLSLTSTGETNGFGLPSPTSSGVATNQSIPVLNSGRLGMKHPSGGGAMHAKIRTASSPTVQSTSEFNFELTEGQCRRSLMADCEYECSEIFDFLYVGGAEIAKSWDILERYGIRRIVNCSASVVENYFQELDNMRYLSLSMVDGRQDDISWFMCDVAQFVLKALQDGEKVLIHCERGVSRSCSFAIAYHMWSTGSNWKESFEHVKACRVVCAPNTAFTCNLIEISDMLHGSSLCKPVIFRCAAHLPHDCETPVLKICRNFTSRKLVSPRTSILDPNGVFLLRVPEGGGADVKCLYIWQGQSAPDEVARIAATIAVSMIGVLTSAKKIVLMKMGKEVPEFYDYVLRDGSFDQQSNADESYDDFYEIQPEASWAPDPSIDTSNLYIYDGEKYLPLSEKRPNSGNQQQQDPRESISPLVPLVAKDVVPSYTYQFRSNSSPVFATQYNGSSRPLSFPSPSAIDRLKGRSKLPLLSVNDCQVDGIAIYAPRVPDPPSPSSPSMRRSLPGRAIGISMAAIPSSSTMTTNTRDNHQVNFEPTPPPSIGANSSETAIKWGTNLRREDNAASAATANISLPNQSANLVIPQFRGGKPLSIINPSEGSRPSLMLPQPWATSSPHVGGDGAADHSSSSPAILTRKYRSDSTSSSNMRSPSASPISLPLLNIPPADGPPSPLAFRLPGELGLVRGPTPTPTPRTPMSSMRKEFNQSSIMIEVPIDIQNLPPQKQKPRLYQFAISPIGEHNYRWEAMGIYEEDDLDEKNVLLLACPEGPHYLWIGTAFDFTDLKGFEDVVSVDQITENILISWAAKVKRGDVKAVYAVEDALQRSGALEIVRDGHESEAFWVAFNEGME